MIYPSKSLILLSLLMILSLNGISQEDELPKLRVGVGVGIIIPNILDNYYDDNIQNAVPIFILPIKYSNIKIEPEFGKHHRTGNEWSYNYCDALNIGIGVLGLKEYNHFTLQYGVRSGVIKNKRSYDQYWYDPSIDVVEKYRAYYIAPIFGFEYNIFKHLSLGSELQLRFIKQKSDRLDESTESSYQRVKLFIGVRFYF